ncbi:hypothetical protein EXIGLDRAFT_744406 [Exidia glandulosa HHB12029]|uniref:Uncharacterized protein n=1 Tax=Exidia glandulosa HHB12029 TaxID=1314781 RepID=A0A166BPF1_EXIGL|nr:hypothetical protein EXIGLDRAFT_744406 [Exidia glandulosa HHB12029]
MRLNFLSAQQQQQLAAATAWPIIEVTAPDDEPATLPASLLNSPFQLGARQTADLLQVPRRTACAPQRMAAARSGDAVGSWRLNCRETPHAARPAPPASKPAPEQDAVLSTMRRLEQYCDSLNNVRARPAPIAIPAAPAPVAAGTTTFKKAHRRVHSVEITWARTVSRTGVATRRTARRGGSITSLDDIVTPLPRSARSALPRRVHSVVLPDLNETSEEKSHASRHTRTRSLDAILATLRMPKPTLVTSRSTRADLHLMTGTGAKQHRYAADDAMRMLPEGFAPSSTLPSKRASYHGSYGSISKSFGDFSKSATTLRKKVFKPLTRYLA